MRYSRSVSVTPVSIYIYIYIVNDKEGGGREMIMMVLRDIQNVYM